MAGLYVASAALLAVYYQAVEPNVQVARTNLANAIELLEPANAATQKVTLKDALKELRQQSALGQVMLAGAALLALVAAGVGGAWRRFEERAGAGR